MKKKTILKSVGISIMLYVTITTFVWGVVSVDIYVANCHLKRLLERRPEMGRSYCKPHKYIPLYKFYTWPIDMSKDMEKQFRFETTEGN